MYHIRAFVIKIKKLIFFKFYLFQHTLDKLLRVDKNFNLESTTLFL